MQQTHITQRISSKLGLAAAARLAVATVVMLGVVGIGAHPASAETPPPVMDSVRRVSASSLQASWTDDMYTPDLFIINVYQGEKRVLQRGFSPTGILRETVDNLESDTRYCLSVQAELFTSDAPFISAESNRLCATTWSFSSLPAAVLTTDVIGKVNTGGASTPAPTLPDLAVTAIRPEASGQITAGQTAIYDVVVANTGAKISGPVTVLIQVTGSLQSYGVATTPAGFNCSSPGTITCTGPLGGYGDPMITTVATFGVRVHAANPGLGSVSAAVDPDNLIPESDKTNNAKTLAVNVK